MVTHLKKNWNVCCHVAEYCHNSCSKCLLFASTHARRCPHHSSIALSMMVWSVPCQTCRKRCFSSSVLCTRNCCLQRIFNVNRKLKKQVSKLNALKLGVCSKINACYIFVCMFSQICQNSNFDFHKVVWQHTEGVVGNIIWHLLEI